MNSRPAGPSSHDPRLFDHFARQYDRRDRVYGGFLRDWVDGVLNGRSGDSAIDLGCGTGDVAARLTAHYRHVRAIDLSEPMLEVARRRYAGLGIDFECQDINQVSGQYDLVISSMVLHHVPDLPLTLRRIGRLVAPGGTVILLDTVGPAPQSRVEHYQWSVKEFLRDLRHAWRRLRVNLEPDWVNHLLSDRWLPADAFAEIYGASFPGATIGTKSGVNTMVWHRDPDGIAAGSPRETELQRAAG